MKRLVGPILVVGLAVTAVAALAATSTGNMNVRMQITAACVVNSATDLDFGSASAIPSAVDQTATLSVTCTSGSPYNLGLNAGLNDGGAGINNRRMKIGGGGTDTLQYQVYRDAGRTQVWGATVGTDTVTGTGNGATQLFTVYGRLPAQPVGAAGTYTDVVTITMTY